TPCSLGPIRKPGPPPTSGSSRPAWRSAPWPWDIFSIRNWSMSISSVYSSAAASTDVMSAARPAAVIERADQAQIDLSDVSLRFRIFTDRSPVLKQFILNKVLGRHKTVQNYQDFWLYRGLSVRIEHGQRVGIVGSNGAG